MASVVAFSGVGWRVGMTRPTTRLTTVRVPRLAIGGASLRCPTPGQRKLPELGFSMQPVAVEAKQLLRVILRKLRLERV